MWQSGLALLYRNFKDSNKVGYVSIKLLVSSRFRICAICLLSKQSTKKAWLRLKVGKKSLKDEGTVRLFFYLFTFFYSFLNLLRHYTSLCSVGIASSDGGLLHVDVIVLDEVHYLSDISRGTVWEEIVCVFWICKFFTSQFVSSLCTNFYIYIPFLCLRLFIAQRKFNLYVFQQLLLIQMSWLDGLVRYCSEQIPIVPKVIFIYIYCLYMQWSLSVKCFSGPLILLLSPSCTIQIEVRLGWSIFIFFIYSSRS